jgi:biopolymer transport protein ExbD
MARNKREVSDEVPELNLAPIMNMVVILIPLLLLSVVFLQVGVINITAPKLSIGPSTDQPPPEDEPLNLTLTLEEKGFRIAAKAAVLPQRPGCPPGPTICLEDQKVKTGDKFKSARGKFEKGDLQGGEKELKEAMAAYNWRELYNELVKIKKQYPDESVINITADPEMPYAMVVRAMDVARFKLSKESFSKSSEFWAATYEKSGNQYAELFPDPVLNLAK